MGNWPWPFLIQIIGDALGLKKKTVFNPRGKTARANLQIFGRGRLDRRCFP